MYQLSQPASALSPYIEHYWSVCASEAAPLDLRVDVYVDARADLIFNFGAPYTRAVLGERPRRLQASNLDAQRTRPMRIEQRGAIVIAGVRFRAAGLAPFVSETLARWTDRVVPIAEAFGPAVLEVERVLAAAPSDPAAQKQILDAYFTSRLQLTPGKLALQPLRARIEAEGGLVRMDALCAQAAVSARQLDRLFRSHLGLSPKTFARVVRFQRALTMLKGDPGCTLAAVAARCGYYDQPHFVREFKAYAGVAPRAQVAYFPSEGPADFSPNVVQFLQDPPRGVG